ncbi:unnamed protein product [Leptidea sinapis]|uniref:Calponin-homology (CH) domain-containing protein n=1 Tax=Leptidea sinapis TaxID=189913 RepID=A0A5E4QWA9_9NEOP|nr:unnamed protein product [Leptidea sinapis]
MPGRPIWQKELEAQRWIEAVIGEKFPSNLPYELALRDGIILCKLMNRLQPGIVPKVNISGSKKRVLNTVYQMWTCFKLLIYGTRRTSPLLPQPFSRSDERLTDILNGVDLA